MSNLLVHFFYDSYSLMYVLITFYSQVYYIINV